MEKLDCSVDLTSCVRIGNVRSFKSADNDASEKDQGLTGSQWWPRSIARPELGQVQIASVFAMHQEAALPCFMKIPG